MLLATVVTTASSVTTMINSKPDLVFMKGVDGTTIGYNANGKLQTLVAPVSLTA